MKLKQILIPILIISVILVSCITDKEILIKHNDDRIQYNGRIGMEDTCAVIYWSGSSIKIGFEGTSVQAIMKDESGDNYFNVIIDNDSINILRPDTTKNIYSLVSQLPEGKHTVEIFKRNEWDRGKTWFYGFQFGEDTKEVFRLPDKSRMIEFYGNSISAGYAIEDYSDNDSPDSIYTNSYLAYTALTARHFNAELSCIVKGGIGIMISWFPMIMPEIYNRINPIDPESVWDFSQKTPDIVVINLFQNDSWLVNMPDYEEFKRVFDTMPPEEDFIIQSYSNFVQTIRAKYPDANIICMLGNMDITREGSPWPGYVKKAAASLNDDKVFTHFVPYKNTPGHPRVEEQKIMAQGLIQFIEENIEW